MRKARHSALSLVLALAVGMAATGPALGVEATTLRISGFDGDEVTQQFLASHPQVRIQYDNEKHLTEDALIRAMLTQDGTCDIFTLNSDWGLAALGRKGYFFDLSGNAAIAALARDWYPQIREALSAEGKIIAYPIGLSMALWGINPALPALYPVFTPPEDFRSFLRGLAMNQDIREEWEASYVIEVPGREWLLRRLIQAVLLSGEQSGAQPDFQQEAFVLCAEAIRNMEEPQRVDEFQYDALFKLPTYLSLSQDLLDPNSPYTLFPPPPLTLGQFPVVETTLTVMLVNPHSQNADLALAYLGFRAAHEKIKTAYLLSPKRQEPVENPAYQALVAERQAEIGRLTGLLEGAEPDRAYELREQIDLLERNNAAEHSRWIISQPSLDAYRALAPSLYIPMDSPLLGLSGEKGFENLTPVIARYLDRQIEVAQLAQELNRKVGLLYGEDPSMP